MIFWKSDVKYITLLTDASNSKPNIAITAYTDKQTILYTIYLLKM